MSPNKAYYLLLASFAVIFAGMANLFLKALSTLLFHAIYFCQRSLTNLGVFPHLTAVLLIVSLSSITALGLLVLIVQTLKTRSFIKKLFIKETRTPQKLESILQRLGLTNKIDVVDDKRHLSFCYGLLRPRICLSTGLIKSLGQNEIVAILLHESYHLENRDPLRIVLGKTLSSMLFFVPTLKDFQSFYSFSKEIAADQVAVRNGQRHSLVSALTKLLDSDVSRFSAVARLFSPQDWEGRIAFLTGQQRPTVGLSKGNLAVSAVAVVFMLIVSLTPVKAVVTTQNSSHLSCNQAGELVDTKNFSESALYTPAR